VDPTLTTLILFLAIGLVTLAAAMVLRDLFVLRGQAVGRRLQEQEAEVPLGRLPLAEDAPRRGITGKFDFWFDRLIEEMDLDISTPAAFLMAVACGLLVGGVMFLWQENVLAASGGMLAGMVIAIGFFAFRRARRRRAIREQLPDVMELLARASRAGQSVDQAIDLVGETAREPLGTEFRRCARQLEMGLSMDAAMRALSRRAPISETRILAATFMVQRRAGGNLPLTLERLAKVIRDRLSYRRHYRAATAAGRISAIVIAVATTLIALYLIVWQRQYMANLLDTTPGQIMLAVALGLQAFGLFWVYRMLRTDY
jgi:tight adherence protein B